MRPRILVVDDDTDIRRLIRLALSTDYHVESVRDGQDAIELLTARPKDFAGMVLDLMMPRKTGFDVLEFVRSNEATLSLPVLVLTARTDKAAQVDTFVGGGHAFMAKPFEVDELVRAVGSLVRGSEASRQAARLSRLLRAAE